MRPSPLPWFFLCFDFGLGFASTRGYPSSTREVPVFHTSWYLGYLWDPLVPGSREPPGYQIRKPYFGLKHVRSSSNRLQGGKLNFCPS